MTGTAVKANGTAEKAKADTKDKAASGKKDAKPAPAKTKAGDKVTTEKPKSKVAIAKEKAVGAAKKVVSKATGGKDADRKAPKKAAAPKPAYDEKKGDPSCAGQPAPEVPPTAVAEQAAKAEPQTIKVETVDPTTA